MGKLLLGGAVGMLGVLVGFVVLFAVMAALLGEMLDSVAGFGSAQVQAWMLDTPQPTGWDQYGTPGAGDVGAVFSGGQVGFAGYNGPASFLCLFPALKGFLTDLFGARREGFPRHSGIDYGTCHQTDLPVFTPLGGQVVYAGWSAVGYGNLVVIENQGYQVYLAHNNAFTVAVGDIVQAGDTVARSGSTGNSTGPHVHFETRACADGHCTPRNPNTVFLPGQDAPCDWNALSAPCE